MIVDLHVHTSWGGYDSSLAPKEAVEEAQKIKLDGLSFSEHNTEWDKFKIDELRNGSGLVLLRGIEVDTELGHILAFGFDKYVNGIYRSADLRREADRIGGFLVAAHPFRRLFGNPGFSWGSYGQGAFNLDEALKREIFHVTDEIEVLNGGCTTRENALAIQVARALGKTGVAGSDAHSASGLGKFITIFERPISSDKELVAELRSGKYFPGSREDGQIVPYAGINPPPAQ